MNRQDDHQRQQTDHHHLGNTLHSGLQTERTDHDSKNYHNHHPEYIDARARQHLTKHSLNAFGIQSGKCSGHKAVKIIKHPTRNRGIKHHQYIVAKQRHITMQMPLASRFFQLLISLNRTFAACTSHRKFHRKNRNTHNSQKQQIDYDKNAAAVCSNHIWKTPYISDTDGASC